MAREIITIAVSTNIVMIAITGVNVEIIFSIFIFFMQDSNPATIEHIVTI